MCLIGATEEEKCVDIVRPESVNLRRDRGMYHEIGCGVHEQVPCWSCNHTSSALKWASAVIEAWNHAWNHT